MDSMVVYVAGGCFVAAALWLLLPRQTRRVASHRILAAGIALGTTGLMLFVSQLPPAGSFRACLAFYPAAAVALAASTAAMVSRMPNRSVVWFGLMSAALIAALLSQNAPWTVVAVLAVHAAFLVALLRFCCDGNRTVGRLQRALSKGVNSTKNLAAIAPPYHPAGVRDADAEASSREPLLSAAVGGIAVVVPAVAFDRAFDAATVTHTAGAALTHNTLVLGAAIFAVGLVGFLGRRHVIVQLIATGIMSQGVSLGLAAWGRLHDEIHVQTLIVIVLLVAACHAAIILAFPRFFLPDRTQQENG